MRPSPCLVWSIISAGDGLSACLGGVRFDGLDYSTCQCPSGYYGADDCGHGPTSCVTE